MIIAHYWVIEANCAPNFSQVAQAEPGLVDSNRNWTIVFLPWSIFRSKSSGIPIRYLDYSVTGFLDEISHHLNEFSMLTPFLHYEAAMEVNRHRYLLRQSHLYCILFG